MCKIGVDDPIFWIMRVGTAHVQSVTISHGLDHSDVITTVEMLCFPFGDATGHISRLQIEGVSLTA